MNYKNLRGNKSARRTRFAVFYGLQEGSRGRQTVERIKSK